jgi:AcrR family transcriptional regulator
MDKNIKNKIIEAAMDIVDEDGFEGLLQSKLAKRVGIRQSHLTYYFPHKPDLLVALLLDYRRRVDIACQNQDVLSTMETMIFDRKRVRFYLSQILEVSEDPRLRAILAEQSRNYKNEIGRFFGVSGDDPRIVDFVAMGLGLGLNFLIFPENYENGFPSLRKLASDLGLEEKKSEDE